MAREHTIEITDMSTGKVTRHTTPAPEPGEWVNSIDLTVGDIFEYDGELYKVTDMESIGCMARPLNAPTGPDTMEMLFPCVVVNYKGR